MLLHVMYKKTHPSKWGFYIGGGGVVLKVKVSILGLFRINYVRIKSVTHHSSYWYI